MRFSKPVSFGVCFLLLAAQPALLAETAEEESKDRVTIEWVNEDNYRDFEESYGTGRNKNIKSELEKAFRREARKNLPEDVFLEVEVVHADLAGEFHPNSFHDRRIVRDPFWPSFVFEYVVRDSEGTILAEGSRKEWGFDKISLGSDPYRHEKALIRAFMRHVAREVQG